MNNYIYIAVMFAVSYPIRILPLQRLTTQQNADWRPENDRLLTHRT